MSYTLSGSEDKLNEFHGCMAWIWKQHWNRQIYLYIWSSCREALVLDLASIEGMSPGQRAEVEWRPNQCLGLVLGEDDPPG